MQGDVEDAALLRRMVLVIRHSSHDGVTAGRGRKGGADAGDTDQRGCGKNVDALHFNSPSNHETAWGEEPSRVPANVTG
jgi:hypothetical protein